jgi:mucin-19
VLDRPGRFLDQFFRTPFPRAFLFGMLATGKGGHLMPMRFFAGAILAACLCGVPQPANAACTEIFTAAQLQAMRDDRAGIYCLRADIDLSSIPNFIPIGNSAKPFTGELRGNNHVIRNLTISRDLLAVGLFGFLDGSILDADITSTGENASAGILVGSMIGGAIRNVHVDGRVMCTLKCFAGGLGGGLSGSVQGSSSAANISALTNSSQAGGLSAGLSGTGATITTSFATVG